MTPAPLDAGLQPERTELAWRRTASAIAVGSLISMRILPLSFGHPAWILVGIGGLTFAVWMLVQARRRCRRMRRELLDPAMAQTSGGGALLGVALFTSTCGAATALYLVALAGRAALG